MKKICLGILSVFITSFALSQSAALKLSKIPESKYRKDFIDLKHTKRIFPVLNLSKPGVIELPSDNMPCLIPDLNYLAAMPVIKYFGFVEEIPNPYFRNQINPGSTNSYLLNKRDLLFKNYTNPADK